MYNICMLKIERVLKDGNGREWRVSMEIDEAGKKLENALMVLGSKALRTQSMQAKALGGAVRVKVERVG